jgi:hypothetical protein
VQCDKTILFVIISPIPAAVPATSLSGNQMTIQMLKDKINSAVLVAEKSAIRYKSVGISVTSNNVLSVSVLATDTVFPLFLIA